MTRPQGPSIIRSAHGTARRSGAILVAEAPPLDEMVPPNAELTGRAIERRRVRGRPFARGNAAARDRAPQLCRVTCEGASSDETRRVLRRARNLQIRYVRELSVRVGGPLLSDTRTEIVAWARCVAWAEHLSLAGDHERSGVLAERASAHLLRARGLAERDVQRDAASKGHTTPADMAARVLGGGGGNR